MDAVALTQERQAGMRELDSAMSAIEGQLDSRSTDFALVEAQAEEVEALADRMDDWFDKAAATAAGSGTRPDAWTQPQEFRREIAKFEGASRALKSAARLRNAGRLRSARVDAEASCASCHARFRSKKAK